MTDNEKNILHKVQVVLATAEKLVKEASFPEQELVRLYGPAPQKANQLSAETRRKFINDFRDKTIYKKKKP